MNLKNAFAGVLVPVMAVLSLGAAPALAADPAPAPATTATSAPTGTMTKPTPKKPGTRRNRRPRAKLTAAQRAAWRKAHPNAGRGRRRKPGAAKPTAPKPMATPTTKP